MEEGPRAAIPPQYYGNSSRFKSYAERGFGNLRQTARHSQAPPLHVFGQTHQPHVRHQQRRWSARSVSIEMRRTL